ncbi:hypothetical protein D3C81_2044890 [compost metagenome]
MVATAAFTVTVQVYFFLSTVAVMVALPAFFAVTFPVLLTVATVVLLDFQVTFDLVPVILSTFDLPTSRVNFF